MAQRADDDLTGDEAEIVALIHRNRIAVWTNDFDTWDTCFVHAPYTTRWGWWRSGGIFIRQGFDLLSARLRTSHLPASDRNAHDTRLVNLNLQIRGDMAWATFDQHYPMYDEPGHIGPGIVHEMRVFERIDGAWKIALLGFLDGNGGSFGARAIQLDPEGRVLWKSTAAEAALADSDDLVVRNGRLRFRDSRVDRKLQDAVKWAAAQDSGYMSANAAVPIVTEAGEDLPTRIYWVAMDAGMIVFSFGAEALDQQRLDLAAAIYGLSPAQKELAAHVAEGLSLVEIAERMNITANTARTHLNRVFDKTGVRTQPALVRVLLSAAAPL